MEMKTPMPPELPDFDQDAALFQDDPLVETPTALTTSNVS